MSEKQAQPKEAQVKKAPAKKEFRKVAICGTAETLSMAPFEDDSFDIWGCATCVGHEPFKRATMLFEMHKRDRWIKRLENINKLGVPVMMQDRFKDVPTAIEYPIKAITEKLGRYFTNSISYMVALAIMQDYDHIALFGVHFATNPEYEFERPNLEYYLGLARGLGIDVYVPKEADILYSSRLYGYDHSDIISIIKQRLNGYVTEEQKLKANIANNEAVRNQYIGAAEVCKYMMQLERR